MQSSRFAARYAFAPGLLATTFSAHAGTIAVTSTATPAAGVCTLAQAIHAANLANNPLNATPTGATTIAPLSNSVAAAAGIGTCTGATAGANTIDLSLYAGATITLSVDAPDNFWFGPNALPPIASTITIEGHAVTLFIQAGLSPRLRFFFIGADPQLTATAGYNTPGPGNLTLHNLSLSGGRQKGGDSQSGGGGAGMGGAIFNQGTLTLNAVTLSGNTALGGGVTANGASGGGGMGADANAGSGGGMGGAVPAGSSEAAPGFTTCLGSVGGGPANGMGGQGGAAGAAAGDGSGGGGRGGGYGLCYFGGGGGGGFGGGAGGYTAYVSGSGGGFGFGGSGGGHGGGGGGAGGGGGGGGYAGGGGGFGGGGGAGLGGEHGFGAGNTRSGGSGLGGAIFNFAGTVNLLNATLTGNSASGGNGDPGGGTGGDGLGGAIFNLNGIVNVSFSTLAFNSSSAGSGGASAGHADGGAIYSLGYNALTGPDHYLDAVVNLGNSILAGSNVGYDLIAYAPAAVTGGLVNTSQASSALSASNIVVAANPDVSAVHDDPLLGLLGANGAENTPRTLAPQPGSPATQAGSCVDVASNPVGSDERGFPRPASGCDLGAYDGERPFASGFELP